MASAKKRAWKACAKYIKLRDAIEDFPITNDLDLVRCRTCGKWMKTNSREAQACHFIGRGIGGGSGVYFDERNIHIGCYQCNCFKQGAPIEYEKFMLEKYGPDVLEELKIKHRLPKSFRDIDMIATEMYYKEEYQRLITENGL